jgi:carboxybiotin decarboxylase
MDTFFEIFQGIGTLADGDWKTAFARIALMMLGGLLIYLGKKGTLEPLLMIPMGMGMIAVNAGVLFLDPVSAQHSERYPSTEPAALLAPADPATLPALPATVPPAHRATGTLMVEPLVSEQQNVMYFVGLDFLQPVYSFAFGNGLIACLVFLGIGVLLDVGYVLARPIQSMFLALCAELGTILTFPIAIVLFDMSYGEAASVAMIGSADGPMVMFTTLKLAPHLFVPITVVGYLYLGLTYGGYPYLIKLLVPKSIRGTHTERKPMPFITSGEKLAFAVVACGVLCLLFPMAAPLILSLFLGVAIRESELTPFIRVIEQTLLYGATLFLGLMLGVLCGAEVLLDPVVLKLLLLGILALLLSGIGGIGGGYALYFLTKKRYNPIIGIAGVSCVPTTAKVVQKLIQKEAPGEIVLPEALGANISGVITSAILCGVYVALVPIFEQAMK